MEDLGVMEELRLVLLLLQELVREVERRENLKSKAQQQLHLVDQCTEDQEDELIALVLKLGPEDRP
jgi:hypothetical protein